MGTDQTFKTPAGDFNYMDWAFPGLLRI